MRHTHADYDDVIKHYQKMAEINPALNDAVANHAMPAEFAYDLAKKDMKISELSKMEESDDWKQFQEWKKAKDKQTTAQALSAPAGTAQKPSVKVPPNLNKTTGVGRGNSNIREEDEELFAGAL